MNKCTIKKYVSLLFILTGLVLMNLSACQTATPIPTTLDDRATITAEMKKDAQIKLSDNGRTFSYHLTDRFSVFLDDTKYPVKDLTCTPNDIIDIISNGSLRGPDRYPILFEAVVQGKCRLEDHDFHAEIIVKP